MRSPVGVIYTPEYLRHETGPFHRETPQRLQAILKTLSEDEVARDIPWLEPRRAPLSMLSSIHQREMIQAIARLAKEPDGGWIDSDTRICPQSYEIALLAAGGAMTAVDWVMKGDYRRLFTLARPPGHHATKHRSMGFCLFNNIAFAAEHAIARYGLKRVMILDWDVHHGNGTESIFYDRSDVLYVSLHREPPFWPNSGYLGDIGIQSGKGYNINIPLPAGTSDREYEILFDRIISPIADRYQPELILISAGYDAHERDPLGGMNVSVTGFRNWARKMVAIAEKHCDGRIVATLEGGYDLKALSYSVLATLRAFLDPELFTFDPLVSVTDEERSGWDVEPFITQVNTVFS